MQNFNIHILKQGGLQLNYTTWEKKHLLLLVLSLPFQFPWYHLAAILEETVNDQFLVLFSCCSSLSRPLSNHDQNLYHFNFHHLWVLAALTPLHSSFPMSTWCRGFCSQAAPLSLRNPSAAFLLPFPTWISHWWTSFDFKGQKEILLLLSGCICESTVAQVMVSLLKVSICYTSMLNDGFQYSQGPLVKHEALSSLQCLKPRGTDTI